MKKILILLVVLLLLVSCSDEYTGEELLTDYRQAYEVLDIISEYLDLTGKDVKVMSGSNLLSFQFAVSDNSLIVDEVIEGLSDHIIKASSDYVMKTSSATVSEERNNILSVTLKNDHHLLRMNNISKNVSYKLDKDNKYKKSESTSDINVSFVLLDEKLPEDTSLESVETDTLVEYVVNSIFTLNEEDYSYTAAEYESNMNTRHESVKDYCTEDGYKSIRYSGMIPSLEGLYSDYYCTTVVDHIKLDFRPTSDDQVLICYFELDLTSSFIDLQDKSFTGPIGGEMTLKRIGNEWKIDYLNVNITSDHHDGFFKYVADHDIQLSKDSYKEYLKSEVALLIIGQSDEIALTSPDDTNKKLIFNNHNIEFTNESGEPSLLLTYKDCDYDWVENSFTFYIISEDKYIGGTSSVSDVDFYVKIILNDDGVTYYHHYTNDEMVKSLWLYDE